MALITFKLNWAMVHSTGSQTTSLHNTSLTLQGNIGVQLEVCEDVICVNTLTLTLVKGIPIT